MKEFSIEKFFELMDKNDKNELDLEEIEDFLKDLELQIESKDILLLLQRFGNKETMKIDLNGLKNLINPKSEEFQFMTEEKEEWNFSDETLGRAAELFAVIFETERKIEDQRYAIEEG